MEGYIIKNIKNQISFALQVRRRLEFNSRLCVCDAAAELLPEQAHLLSRPQPGNSNAWFEGAHLLPLLRKVLTLPDGPETDLLQYLDRFANIRHNPFPVVVTVVTSFQLICNTESWSL